MAVGVGPLVHRVVLHTPEVTAPFRKVRQATDAWLTSKIESAPPAASGVHRLDPERVLLVQAAYADGDEHAIRLQLREDQAEATWRTTVTAVTPPGAGVLAAVTLEVFVNGDARPTVGRPRVVRDLVEALQPVDGPAALTLRAQPVTADRVDHLINALCDPERHLPAVVAADPVRPSGTWTKRLETIERECAGAASLYRLAGPEAVTAFRNAVGADHWVAPGVIRTYLPEVDPAWHEDGARHRFVTAQRLDDATDQAWRGLFRAVQRLSTSAAMPEDLRDVVFPDDEGRRSSAARHAVLQSPHVSVELAQTTRENQELRDLLSAADNELAEARRGQELSNQAVNEMELQLLDAWAAQEEDAEAAQRALDQSERLRAENEVYRQRFHQSGQHEDAVISEPVAGVPATFEELWDRLGLLTGLLITADRTKALELDEEDRAQVWAAKVWTGLQALDAYARADKEGFNGGFFEYCKAGLGPLPWPAKQVAMVESESTMNRWGDQRVFAAPSSVDPSGRIEMQSHLKVERRTVCPRIHFLDNTKGATGKVIVGYIGRHLTNTKSD